MNAAAAAKTANVVLQQAAKTVTLVATSIVAVTKARDALRSASKKR